MTRVLAFALVALGIAIVARTVAAGIGGGVGLVLGALFVAAGVGRLYTAGRS